MNMGPGGLLKNLYTIIVVFRFRFSHFIVMYSKIGIFVNKKAKKMSGFALRSHVILYLLVEMTGWQKPMAYAKNAAQSYSLTVKL